MTRIATIVDNEFGQPIDISGRFDRVVSIEMFEHMRNYEELLRRIAGWLCPAGLLFVHPPYFGLYRFSADVLRFELEVGGERYYATAARTFGDARPGEIVLYEDSYRNVAVAINRGNAAEMFSVRAGQPLELHVQVP